MVRALRVVTVQRGIDPRSYALLAFGGAGPLHAAAIASELGITRIACPRASGVLAALGLVVSPRRRDVQRSVFLSGEELSVPRSRQRVGELGAQARAELGEEASDLHAVYELRYRGQAFELPVAAAPSPRRRSSARRLRRSTRSATGTATPSRNSSWSRSGCGEPAASELELGASDGEPEPERTQRRATWPGRSSSSPCCEARRRPGREIEPAAIIELRRVNAAGPAGLVRRGRRDGHDPAPAAAADGSRSSFRS